MELRQAVANGSRANVISILRDVAGRMEKTETDHKEEREMACLFGHKWDGCKCTKCGKVRDNQHDWDGCVCKRCGAKRDEQHDSDLCIGICKKCGAKQPEMHEWNGCVCKRCGKVRDEQHDWDLCLGVCRKCGKECSGAHEIESCVCMRCGREFHTWENGACAVCGVKKTQRHVFKEIMDNLEASYDSAGRFSGECDVEHKFWIDDFNGHKAALLRPAFSSQDENSDFAEFKDYMLKLTKGCKICFGRYEQWKTGATEPIEWSLLGMDEKGALLLSEYCLEARSFHSEDKTDDLAWMGWKDSNIREWLNNDFYNEAFSASERALIEIRSHETKARVKGEPPITTNDKAFLLGCDDLHLYMGRFFEDTTATERCKELRYRIYIDRRTRMYNIGGTAKELDGCVWWLRDFSFGADSSIMFCWQNGKPEYTRGYCPNTICGIRPAIWLSLEGLAKTEISPLSIRGRRPR